VFVLYELSTSSDNHMMNIDTLDFGFIELIDLLGVLINGDGFASDMSSSLHVTGWHYSLWRFVAFIL